MNHTITPAAIAKERRRCIDALRSKITETQHRLDAMRRRLIMLETRTRNLSLEQIYRLVEEHIALEGRRHARRMFSGLSHQLGFTLTEIGSYLGCSASTARRHVGAHESICVSSPEYLGCFNEVKRRVFDHLQLAASHE
jgi:hypothetical protein